MSEIDKNRFLRPWAKWKHGPNGFIRMFYYYSESVYAARAHKLPVDWFCTDDGKPGGDYSVYNKVASMPNLTIEELMHLIDERLLELGYILLTESQVKTMDLLA